MLAKVLLFALTNRAFQTLLLDGLAAVAKRSDNALDDQVVQIVRDRLGVK